MWKAMFSFIQGKGLPKMPQAAVRSIGHIGLSNLPAQAGVFSGERETFSSLPGFSFPNSPSDLS